MVNRAVLVWLLTTALLYAASGTNDDFGRHASCWARAGLLTMVLSRFFRFMILVYLDAFGGDGMGFPDLFGQNRPMVNPRARPPPSEEEDNQDGDPRDR